MGSTLKPIWLKPATIQDFLEYGTCGQTQDELMNYILDTRNILFEDLEAAHKRIEILEKQLEETKTKLA